MPGEARYGQISFNANCGGCHGMDAQYETDLIGPTLRSPQLLGLMDDSMMYETIVRGREGTAMPAWGFMSIQELADLMEYTRTWRTPPVKLRAFGDAVGRGSKRRGSHYYAEHCASCHGNDGEGGIGPSLTSPELLRSADDRFLHATLTRGRRGTAMSSYNYLGAGKLHSYLEGVGIEIMGNSDNVIRGGLTTKHVDVPELCRVLRFEPGEPEILLPREASPGERIFETPVDEFELAVISVAADKPWNSSRSRGVEILLSIEGVVKVVDRGAGESFNLEHGASVLIPNSVERYELVGEGVVYRAGVPRGSR